METNTGVCSMVMASIFLNFLRGMETLVMRVEDFGGPGLPKLP